MPEKRPRTPENSRPSLKIKKPRVSLDSAIGETTETKASGDTAKIVEPKDKPVEQGELKKTPEEEAEQTVDTVVSESEAKESAKSFGKYAIDITRVEIVTVAKLLWGLVKLAKEAVTGKLSFKKGKEIADETFGDKNNKK